MKSISNEVPLAYFITFTCYGTWLHGAKEYSVDLKNNVPGTPFLHQNIIRHTNSKERLLETPYSLNQKSRNIVLKTIKEVCNFRKWDLLAAHIRTNHVHLLVCSGLLTPEKVMDTIKSYTTRRLREAGANSARTKWWTRHGSTRYIWNIQEIEATIQYIIYEQGKPMAVYENSQRCMRYNFNRIS